jgi:hypothetical protein
MVASRARGEASARRIGAVRRTRAGTALASRIAGWRSAPPRDAAVGDVVLGAGQAVAARDTAGDGGDAAEAQQIGVVDVGAGVGLGDREGHQLRLAAPLGRDELGQHAVPWREAADHQQRRHPERGRAEVQRDVGTARAGLLDDDTAVGASVTRREKGRAPRGVRPRDAR